MPYTLEQLTQLYDERSKWEMREDDLNLRVLGREYANERAKEFATHGFSRRLNMIRHCINRTFDVVPPEILYPDRSELMDASAFIQTFVINTYGAIDNLAHIWCHHRGLTDKHGRTLNTKQIGLTTKCKEVRATLSCDFSNYLDAISEWFAYLENYRHSLAHRIPLYIPPRGLNEADQAIYRELEARQAEARRRGDWRSIDALMDEQQKLGSFDGYIMHSFGEQSAPIRFHAQMICDAATVIEIGEYMLSEIERYDPPSTI